MKMITGNPKRVLVYGATGMVGRHVVGEALRRGHAVTGATRRSGSKRSDGISLVPSDAADASAVRHLSRGFDAVVSATRPARGREFEHVAAVSGLVEGLRGTGRRLVVVGGAASLRIPESERTLALDDPRFVQDGWRAIAQACVDQLGVLHDATLLEWSYVSPPAFLMSGHRTGNFRSGVDRMLVDSSGRSQISYADFAVAVVDEVERPEVRRRVTVAY